MYKNCPTRTSARNIVVALLYVSMLTVCLVPRNTPAKQALQPQCAQYCVDITCKLLGVPVSIDKIMDIFSPKKGGQSMLAMKQALEYIGFTVEGRQVGFGQLASGPFPLIAHMKTHFAVVETVTPQFVSVFDNAGRRDIKVDDFLKHWEGYVLYVGCSDNKFLPAYLPSPSRKDPRIKFDTLFCDKGDISLFAGNVDFEFHFQNIGNAPLEVRKVITSCKCATPDMSNAPILPGERAKVIVTYKTGNKRGPFSYSAYVQTNDPRFPVTKLLITGNVVKKVHTNPPELDFGEIVFGQSKKSSCFIRYDGNRLLNLQPGDSDVRGLKSEIARITQNKASQIIGAPHRLSNLNTYRNRYIVMASVDTSTMPMGNNNGLLNVTTNLADFPTLPIPVKIQVVPPVKAKPAFLFLGEISHHAQIDQQITLFSISEADFRIDSIDVKNTGLFCTYDPKPAQRAPIRFQGEFLASHEPPDKHVDVIVSMPDSEKSFKIAIPVYAYIRPQEDPRDPK